MNYNVSGVPPTRIDLSETFGEINVSGSARLVVDAAGNRYIKTQTLTVETNAFLDLNDNDMIVTSSSYATIAARVAAARNGGAWNGKGITSSAAAGEPNHATMLGVLTGAEYISVNGTSFHGHTVNNADVLVKYTRYGDADFNGEVNFDDYVQIDNGFNNSFNGWFNGDFDLSGGVDFDDYVLIDLGLNQQGGQLRGGETAWQQIAQMEHFSESYMYYLIGELEKHDIWLTEADFLPLN